MPFFDKNKVKLQLNVNSVIAMGGALQGNLSMTVIEDLKCRAVRLKVVGVEETTRRVRQGKRSRTITDSIVHYSQVVNLMDSSNAMNHDTSNSISSDEIMLRTGNYTFNIQIAFPFNLPPSFFMTHSSGRTLMQYNATACVDIPMGFDAELDFPFLILSAIPRSMYDRGRTIPYKSAIIRSPVSKGCCGCCSSENLGYIETSAELWQTVLIVSTAPIPSSKDMPPLPLPIPQQEMPYLPSPPPQVFPRASNELSMRIYVSNASKKVVIKTILVQLFQGVEILTRGRRSYTKQCIGSTTVVPPYGDLCPGKSTSVDTVLSVSQPFCSSGNSLCSTSPLPSLSTPLTTTNTFLSITFPSVEVEEPFLLLNTIVLSSVVDAFSRLPEQCVYMPIR